MEVALFPCFVHALNWLLSEGGGTLHATHKLNISLRCHFEIDKYFIPQSPLCAPLRVCATVLSLPEDETYPSSLFHSNRLVLYRNVLKRTAGDVYIKQSYQKYRCLYKGNYAARTENIHRDPHG